MRRDGFAQGCLRCRQIKQRGQFVIILIIDGEQYYVGPDKPSECCGEAKEGWFSLFTTQEAANAEADRINAVLKRDGHVENLRLIRDIQLSRSPSTAEN